MNKRQAKVGTRVRDVFGAIGTITDRDPDGPSRVYVKWDGESIPKQVHVSNLVQHHEDA